MLQNELSPKEQLIFLHSLFPTEPAVWQTETDLFQDVPEALQQLHRYSSGEIPIDKISVQFSFLMQQENLTGMDWKKLLDPHIAEGIIRALQRLSKSKNGLGAITEISIAYYDQQIPGTSILAHGYSPAIYETTSTGKIVFAHSGSIILFPDALSNGPYLGQLPDIPHIEGMVTHEFAHQYLNNASHPLGQEWIREIGWTPVDGENDRFICTYPNELPTSYAATHPVEDFAESFMLYSINPAQLQSISHTRFHFFKLRGY